MSRIDIDQSQNAQPAGRKTTGSLGAGDMSTGLAGVFGQIFSRIGIAKTTDDAQGTTTQIHPVNLDESNDPKIEQAPFAIHPVVQDAAPVTPGPLDLTVDAVGPAPGLAPELSVIEVTIETQAHAVLPEAQQVDPQGMPGVVIADTAKNSPASSYINKATKDIPIQDGIIQQDAPKYAAANGMALTKKGAAPSQPLQAQPDSTNGPDIRNAKSDPKLLDLPAKETHGPHPNVSKADKTPKWAYESPADLTSADEMTQMAKGPLQKTSAVPSALPDAAGIQTTAQMRAAVLHIPKPQTSGGNGRTETAVNKSGANDYSAARSFTQVAAMPTPDWANTTNGLDQNTNQWTDHGAKITPQNTANFTDPATTDLAEQRPAQNTAPSNAQTSPMPAADQARQIGQITQMLHVLDTRDQQWGAQLADQMRTMAQRGEMKAELVLKPKSLGILKLSLEMNGHETQVRIVTETPAAARLLMGAEDRLGQMLEGSGMRLSDFSASSGGQSGFGHNFSGKENQNDRNRTAQKTIKPQDSNQTDPLQATSKTRNRSNIDMTV